MISIERTTDMELVKDIITDPSIFEAVCDDQSADVEKFEPVDHESVYYLLMVDTEAKEVGGLFILHPINGVTLEVHTCVLPHMRGPQAVEACKNGIQWLSENTNYKKVVTHVPAYNSAAFQLAQAAGMELEGRSKKSIMKHGVLHDQYVLGVSVGEV